MGTEAVGYGEDVEQARRRFVEFRQGHAVRSRLPEELWAMAAKLARRDGCGPAEPAEVDGSIGAARIGKVCEGSAPPSAGREWRARLRGTAGGDHGNGQHTGMRVLRLAREPSDDRTGPTFHFANPAGNP
jgi:hypothetical protein